MFKTLKSLFSRPQSTGGSSQLSGAPAAGAVNTGLLAWWMAQFSEAEREHILTKYQPLVMGQGGGPYADAYRIIRADGRPIIKLTALATWFMSPQDDLPLAMRLLRKGVELGEEKHGTILDQHFALLNVIKVSYRNRGNDVESLELAIDACERQIALAPLAAEMFKREERVETLPAHTGFQQLAIIKEREEDYDEAIRLSSEALSQGWSGDWEKRIARCDRKKRRSSY